MPTADDYRRAAEDFAAQARAIEEEAAPLAAGLGDDVVAGGRLRPLLDDAVAAVVRGIGVTADGLAAIAEECRRRAVTCEDYSAALDRYHQALHQWRATPDEDRRGPAPLPPAKPAPWVRPD